MVQDRAEQLIDPAEGGPNLEGAIRAGADIAIAKSNLQTQLYNVQPLPNSAPIGFVDTENVLGLVCWAFGPELKAKISAELTKLADDRRALSEQQRQSMAAQIGEEMLALERRECALMAAGDARGEIIDHRPDVSPAALLAVTLRTLSAAEMPRGTSRGHAYDVFGR